MKHTEALRLGMSLDVRYDLHEFSFTEVFDSQHFCETIARTDQLCTDCQRVQRRKDVRWRLWECRCTKFKVPKGFKIDDMGMFKPNFGRRRDAISELMQLYAINLLHL